MVKINCSCGKMLHGDECIFENPNYDFELWVCPYCGEYYTFKKETIQLSEEEGKSLGKKEIKTVPLFAHAVEKDELFKEMRENNDKIISLIGGLKKQFEKAGFKVE